MGSNIEFQTTIKGVPLVKIKSRDIIEKTQKGSFYMNSLKFYRELYANSKDETVGDPFEGQFYVHEAYVDIPEKGVHEHILDNAIPTKNENDYVYCMFGVNPQIHESFVFSDEQKEKLLGFDDSALIIKDVEEYFNRVRNGAIKNGYSSLIGKFVNYYDPQIDDASRIASFLDDMKNIVFFKRNQYAYQQEFRFTLEYIPGVDHIEFNIGDISDISEIISTEQFLRAIIKKK